jgi:hypothetical protein
VDRVAQRAESVARFSQIALSRAVRALTWLKDWLTVFL